MKKKFILPFIALLFNWNSIQNLGLTKEFLLHQEKIKYEESIKSFRNHLDSIKYVSDIVSQGVYDYWQTPKETDSLKTGDCEDKSLLMYSLLKEKGLSPYLVWGRLNKEDNISHIWLEYKIGNNNYIIETSSKIKIILKDTLDKNKYLLYKLLKKQTDKIKDYEKKSGLELKFKNKIIQQF